MELTLRDALKIEPFCRARVVAGESGLSNVVKSVNLIEVPDILNWVKEGDLLVATLYPFHDDSAQIQNLVPSLKEKGLAGLSIKLHRYIEEFSQHMIDDANRLNFPLLELPQDISFVEIIQPLTSRILELKTEELKRSETLHRQFMELVLSGGGFAEIANALAHLVNSPVTIVDQFGRVLAQAFILDLEPAHSQFIERDNRGDWLLSPNYQPEILGHWPGSEVKLLRAQGSSGPVDHIACPIKTGFFNLGQIIIWGSAISQGHALDRIAIEHAATVTALKIEELRTVHRVEQRFFNEILEGLLSDRPSIQEKAIQAARGLGHRLTSPYTIILVSSDVPAGKLLTLSEQNRVEEALYTAKRYIRILNPQCVVWDQGTRISVFYPISASSNSGALDSLVRELNSICAAIKTKYAPYSVSIGIGKVQTELTEFSQSYECARQSLDIGVALRNGEGGLVSNYEDMGILQVVSLDQGLEGLKEFCLEILGPLLDYDQEYNSELLETLRAFLQQNQNASQASKVLYIHYNTLRYRLKIIEKLLGNFYENPQKRLAVEVALQIYPLIRQS